MDNKELREEFEKEYYLKVFNAYPEYAESHKILLNDIADFWFAKMDLQRKELASEEMRKETAKEREFVLQEIKKALTYLHYLEDWVVHNRPKDIGDIMNEHLNT